MGTWQWMKHGSITTLQNQIGNQLSGEQRVKTVQSDQKRKCQLVRFWPSYFVKRTVFHLSITLRKEKLSIANITWRYWCIWRKKLRKNDPKWRRKKCSFTKTMYRVTSWSQQFQNCMNCTLNCFPIHQFSNEEVFAETEAYLRPKINCSTKKATKC